MIGNRMEMKNREMQSVLLSQLKTHLINMLHCQDVRVTTLAVRSIDMMRRHGLSLFMRSQGNVKLFTLLPYRLVVVVSTISKLNPNSIILTFSFSFIFFFVLFFFFFSSFSSIFLQFFTFLINRRIKFIEQQQWWIRQIEKK